MRTALAITIISAVPALASIARADAPPTTQACLGDFTKLACPPGSQRSGTECRSSEPHHGKADGEHWSGSKRQGPAVFLRDDNELDPAKQRVSFAANYRDHKKAGRIFHFDPEGRLESWSDMIDDDYHGVSVECSPEGRVTGLTSFHHGKLVGVSRNWRADGTFAFAFDRGRDGRSRQLDPTPELAQRPDALCHPARCDVAAKPDLSGIPAGMPPAATK